MKATVAPALRYLLLSCAGALLVPHCRHALLQLQLQHGDPGAVAAGRLPEPRVLLLQVRAAAGPGGRNLLQQRVLPTQLLQHNL